MRLVTNKSKNLLYRISSYSNTTVQFGTSYAVATQVSADTKTDIQYKCQYRKDSTYLRDVFSSPIISSTGKITRTFTTPSDLDYNNMVFGINGSTIDTLVSFPIKLKPSTTYTFTCNFTNITQGSVSWKDMMLVEGSTAGEYEPYSYNLLDKWQYPATQTVNGVTWTNNGDGTITANGTTNEVYVQYIIPIPQFKEVKNNHKYVLFSGINDINVSFVECICFLGKQDGSYFATNCAETKFADTVGFVIPQGEYSLWQRVELRVRRGYTANDLTFKPQLYDLTLMYGAGNEPTTVDQFFTDHPELKVSPLGFIGLKNLEISNKNIKRLKYQTGIKKNLFNINNYSIIGEDIGFDISGLEIGKTYTISCNQSNFRWIKISNAPGGHNSVATHTIPYNESSFTFVMSRNSNIPETATQYIFLQMMNSTSSSTFARNLSELGVNQIQIEEGSTATYYVDYNGCVDLGIIPSNSGYILNKYNNLSEELLEENIEKDTVNYHIPDKTNILLNKVEGNTKKVVQLLDKTVFATSDTKVGLTFTCNRTTGAVTVNGTATASSFWNPGGHLPLVNNHKYLICGNYDGIGELGLLNQAISDRGSGAIGTAVTSTEAPRNTWGIAWNSGTTFNNVTFYPQVFDLTAMYGFGKEPTTVEQFKKDYPQFFDEKLDGIWNVKTSGISTTGKNLIFPENLSYIFHTGGGYSYSKNTKLLTLTNVNGSVSESMYKFDKPIPAGTKVTFRIECIQGKISSSSTSLTLGGYHHTDSGSNSWQCEIDLNNYKGSDLSGRVFTNTITTTADVTDFWYFYYTGTTLETPIVCKVMYCIGESTDYEPYQENKIDLLSTQELNGINGVNDYIEVIDKGNGLYDLKKTQNIDSIDLGTLDWATETVGSGINFYSTYTSDKVALSSYPMCQKYTSSSDATYRNSVFFGRYSGALNITADGYDTATAFKTAMNGVILYYQLKTPVTTTIATNLTYNQVSAIRTNGGLLLVNDNNNKKYVQPNVTITENYQYKS